MNENMKAFLAAVNGDDAWAQKLKDATKEDAVALALEKAAELGIELSESDFDAPEGELSEDELVAVAGGGVCFCEIGGGGTSEDHGTRGGVDGVCACVFGGYGSYSTADGDTGTRCVCVQLGSGASYR